MYLYHTLSNGLRIILSPSPSKVVYSGIYINIGSRDEAGRDEGLAHFVEHCLFKGTTHRRAHHISNRIDGVGGELNAFTTKEETCIYATSLREHVERCLELYADVLFCSTFPEAEIEKEKEVVVEEIDSYNDSPAELIYDQFEEYAFEGHPLAHNVLGNKRNVRTFTSERLRRRMSTHYAPSRMVLAVCGDVEFGRLVRLAERYFGSMADFGQQEKRGGKPTMHSFERHIHRRTHQTHLLLGCEAPSLYDTDKTAFGLITNILGGPAMNSRLNIAIRERYGFCYSIESQYVPLTDSGVFYIYAGVDHQAGARALQLMKQELDRIASAPMTERALRQAQQQYIGQMAINNDYGLNEMQSIGKAYLNYSRVDTIEESNEEIMSLTPNDIMQSAQRHFAADKLSVLAYE